MLNGLIQNLCGVGDKNKRNFIREISDKHKLDFIRIQEIIRQDFSKTMLSSIGGDTAFSWIWTPARGKSRGILLGINNDTFDILQRKLELTL
jgi:hypothetical protein